MTPAPPRLADPRLWQIVALTSLLCVGVWAIGFRIDAVDAAAAFAAALGAQAVGSALVGVRFDPLSALITACSLTLLLRADGPAAFALAAAVGVGSKFALRVDGRHFFNPAALGIVVASTTLPGAWVSPGQWGALGLAAAALAGLGAIVAGRAARLDTTAAFLAAFAAAAFGRAAWFGDPIAIPLHQLQTGAVLVFAFFMISDPATTPRRRPERIVHAALVAALGYGATAAWIVEAGPIWALVATAPLVPLLDRAGARLRRRAAAPATDDAMRPALERTPQPPTRSSKETA